MNEIQLLLVGGGISLVSVIITQLIAHVLASRRDKISWHRQETRRLRDIKWEKEEEISRLKALTIEVAKGKILLLNQRRDLLLGLNQATQEERSLVLRTIMDGLNDIDLLAIAEEEAPLPNLPAGPHTSDE